MIRVGLDQKSTHLLPGWGLEFVLSIISCISPLVVDFTALIAWDILGG